MASSAQVRVVGRGRRKEVSGDGRSGKEVKEGQERVDEADLLV